MKQLLIAALMLAAGAVMVPGPASAQVVQYGSTPPPAIVPLHAGQGPIVRSPQMQMPEQSQSNVRPWHMRPGHHAAFRGLR
jgi:hypothetical protein